MMRYAAIACLGLSVVLGQQPSAPQQAPPIIRSQITLVPIDVRVIGRDGAPVTDLTADDFTILEDGVPQPIRHFSLQTFTPDPAAAAVSEQPAFRRSLDDETRVQNRRVFLILLGRGRHQDASKYIDGLLRFVTAQLLPQDQVAVMAWNRATDFTSDHASVGAIIERFRDRHPKIEADLRGWFSGLRAVYGSQEIPPQIQQSIDAVFDAAPELRPRGLIPSPASDAAARTRDGRRAAEELQRDEFLKSLPEGAGSLPDLRAEILSALSGMSFEEYVAQASDTMQDVGSLYAAIDYLRFLEGEKHILLLTERGIDLPLLSGNRGLARIASDARIAIDIIQTGGTLGAPPPLFVQTPTGTRLVMNALPTSGAMFNRGFAIRDLREVSDVTGGHMTAHKSSSDAFSGLGKAIGSQYLLAYAPAVPATDGRFRNIEIKVRRPGVRVQYRRGYFASPRIVSIDRRDFVTFSRIRAAAQYNREIDHIGVTLEGAAPAGDGKTLELVLRMDVSRLSFTAENGRRAAALDIAVYAVDAKGATVGQSLNRADLAFTEEAYQRALSVGARMPMSLPITARPRHVKVVVYDYGADLLGTATLANIK
jgi:VWFA-related protein